MGDVMPCADLPLFLMSGAFLRISSMPTWLYPMKFVSHFYYAMDAISNIYWRQISEIANKGEEHEVLLFLVFTYRVWSFHSCTPLYLGVAVQLPSKATQFVHNNCCKQIVVRQRARWLSHSDGSGAAAAAVA
ncbi:Bm-brown protein, partial [Operophtera brumata]